MRSKAKLLVISSACIALGLMTVFAVELANNQVKSKRDVKTQVHQRAELAAALINSLFDSAKSQADVYKAEYGSQTVKKRPETPQAGGYIVVLNADDTVLTSSPGFNDEARALLPRSGAVSLVRGGAPYGLGNFSDFGTTGIVDFAVGVDTKLYGRRIVVTGFPPSALSTFVGKELRAIPVVRGSSNYLVDGNGIVLAASGNDAIGKPVNQPGAAEALRVPGADVHGFYYDQVTLTNSTWRIVLVSPDDVLFASVSGLRLIVPWVIFVAFVLVAAAAVMLGWRVLRSAEKLHVINEQLETINGALSDANLRLERRAKELERSNEELDQFASIASHDLQEPLRKVRTFTDQVIVLDGDNLSDKGRDYLQRASGAAERMQKLIEDLLMFARVSSQGRPFEPVDLDRITRDVIGDLETQIQNAGAIVTLSNLPTINGDGLQMRQLMQNLISNSLKFSRPDVTPEVTITAETDDRFVHLKVRDNGIGFDPRYSQRIFRVFERLHGHSEYAGTGIGLALCRKIIERHGGQIIAVSELGAGSEFTVTLPLHQAEEVVRTVRDTETLESDEPRGQHARV